MLTLLITGATGNVGLEVLRSLQAREFSGLVRAGVRDVAKDGPTVQAYGAEPVRFDFTDSASFETCLRGVDTLFLMRPPQLADVNKTFRPLVAAARQAGVRHVVFLSVQGAERGRVIPHNRIERLLRESGLAWTFLRAAYFMQNFSTMLRDDLVQRNRIFLPAGRAVFTLVDVRDVGRAGAAALAEGRLHHGRVYELTSRGPLTFRQMAEQLSAGLGRPIRYVSPNLLRFFWVKKRAGLPTGLVLVMGMLHYLPRFQYEPSVSDCLRLVTGHKPIEFEQYVADYRTALS